jgi:Putative transposase
MIASIQTHGDDLGPFHPHLHCLVSDGLFLADGSFFPISAPDPQTLMSAFRHRLLKVLLSREIISSRMVELLLSWRHPGFSVYQGEPVPPEDTAARERLARYILHAPFSQPRVSYDRAEQTVACESKKKNRGTTVFPALDWLAALVTHIPDKGQQLVRLYGRYSNVCQGRRKRMTARTLQPDDRRADGEDGQFRKQCRENWARLIKKILEVDPLICSKCQGVMKIISFIENPPVIHRILAHLDLWDVPKRSPPVSPPRDFIYDPDFFKGLVN